VYCSEQPANFPATTRFCQKEQERACEGPATSINIYLLVKHFYA